MKAAMSGKLADVPTRVTILNRNPLFGEPSIDSLAKQSDAMYSAASVEENLATSVSSSPFRTHSLQRTQTFGQLRSVQDIIEIFDSPVRVSHASDDLEPVTAREERSRSLWHMRLKIDIA